MPTKFQFITELYDQTVRSVTSSYKSWTGFLSAACYNYKCSFDEQILIYAQRPDATDGTVSLAAGSIAVRKALPCSVTMDSIC